MKLPAAFALGVCLPIERISSTILGHPVEESALVVSLPLPAEKALDELKLTVNRLVDYTVPEEINYFEPRKPQREHFYPYQTHKNKQNAKLQKRKKRSRYSRPPWAV